MIQTQSLPEAGDDARLRALQLMQAALQLLDQEERGDVAAHLDCAIERLKLSLAQSEK